MANILVTGGAGFIGSHLVDALVKKHKVTVLDDLSAGRKKFVNPKADFIKKRIQDRNIVELFQKKKFDFVYHLAAQKNLQYSKTHPLEDADTNIIGSIRLLEASKQVKVKKFIFYSTAAVYDPSQKQPVNEKSTIGPVTPYGIGKYAVERYVVASGLSYGILRLSNVYGERQDAEGEGGVVAIFCEKFIKGKRPVVYNSGKQTRDFIYVQDVISASIKVSQTKKSITCNISTGKETSVRDILKRLQKISDKRLLAKKGGFVDEQYRSALLNRKALKEIFWKPRTSLKKGLKETYNWFK